MSNNEIGNSAVYDARELGKGKMFLLGFQHMFAMFGATVLVPLLTGLDVQTTLLMAGLGTILFHIFTKLQVPAFLGSSFAFLGGYTTVSGAFGDFGDKKVVLGLITTKSPELENREEVIARIHEAEKYIPLDRLYLSPQCGFASCEIGNKLTAEEQWAKLTLVKEIAKEVWG